MQENQITKVQHFVPKAYLRSFSSDQKRIWSYSSDQVDKGTLVPIDSICQEKFLYEIRDENGNLSATNWIEHVLVNLEGMYATHLRNLEKKAFNKNNYQTRCFLSTLEKTFWKLFIAIQIVRSPEMIEATQKITKELLGDQLSTNQIHTFAISQCLPFFSELKADDQNILFAFLKPMDSMTIAVGVDGSGSLFTSDSPIFCYSPEVKDFVNLKEYERIVYPLTPKLVLLLFGGEAKQKYNKNGLFPLDREKLNIVKQHIACSANKWFLSMNELSAEDIEIIKSTRENEREN